MDDFQEQQAERDHLYVPAAEGHTETDNFITQGFLLSLRKYMESYDCWNVYI